uniref:Uncharacterized protein n=1 Tax=Globodera rostochiensis TaxID=31243 RepID=A0A914H489_GLORO
MSACHQRAIAAPSASAAILLTLIQLLLLTAQSAHSAPIESVDDAPPNTFSQPTREYAYGPISDTMLRSMLGFGAKKEQNIRIEFLLAPRASNKKSTESERSGDGANAGILLAKRKNAELVNHILKNFASLNRLGDAGRK